MNESAKTGRVSLHQEIDSVVRTINEGDVFR